MYTLFVGFRGADRSRQACSHTHSVSVLCSCQSPTSLGARVYLNAVNFSTQPSALAWRLFGGGVSQAHTAAARRAARNPPKFRGGRVGFAFHLEASCGTSLRGYFAYTLHVRTPIVNLSRRLAACRLSVVPALENPSCAPYRMAAVPKVSRRSSIYLELCPSQV